MVASYLLSSSLVPVFSTWLMKEGRRGEGSRMRSFYEGYLGRVMRFRWPLAIGYLAVSIGLVWLLLPRLGTEIFPDTNPTLYRIRLRAPVGTRLEETERTVMRALDLINHDAGPDKISITSDFTGVQPATYPVNLIHLFTAGPQEALIQIALKPDALRGEVWRERLRQDFQRELPGTEVSFEAGDIISQVMSFGSPTPVEVAAQGNNLDDNYAYARKIRDCMAKLDFLRDVQLAQELKYPTLDIDIDRDRAGQFGLTMADVVRSVVPATSSSRFTSPNYWRDPASGNAFQIQVQLQQNRLQSVDEIGDLALSYGGRRAPRLTEIAGLKLGTMPGLIERYNGQRVVSVTANIHGLTVGQAAARLQSALAAAGAPPKGVTVITRGKIPALQATISGLETGLLVAVAAIFLLLAANFQSGRLALAILLTIPAVLCGVILMLLVTRTTLNIQSFMGGIMAIGIAVANSILLITFAERFRKEGHAVFDAAREGASSRVRAILMTAAAMISGMIPMALGSGESGAQAAPLGRAVIGGLIAATFTTLTVLPSIYAILQGRASATSPSLNPQDPGSRYYEAN
jgi:multidrug efflux pump subunit AcrB